MGNNDPFIPYLATVQSVVDLTPDVKLFTVELNDVAVRESFTYRPWGSLPLFPFLGWVKFLLA